MQWHPVLRRVVSVFRPRERAAAIARLGLTGVVLGSIGGGALIGAGLMALIAPFDGRVMRRKIASLLASDVEAPRSRADHQLPPRARMRRVTDLVVEDEPGFENFDRRAHAG